ncbi:MAG: hypothetical protein KA099_11530 [Alphaproteobacteria bacterium]|nr:hypothetical protein [Alphaproteobacteria bacterium]MBP7758551.1 hypothetical protein [Alphaproteobacteria bacterium]MBP7761983.1 hypothetical protein [Alphaproteobacteria bacterium]MBP7905943.1 hypothetical protein [Alphaproteobacteria bacterium]
MEDSEFSSLTGFWTGVYDYPGNVDDAVPFNAIIIDIAGSISGESDEPNTITPAAVDRLCAQLSGLRDGPSVIFIKTYEQLPHLGHQLRYAGTVNSAFTKIEGQWNSIEDKSWSGPFVMNRSGNKKSEEREIKQSEDVFERQT